MAADDLDGFVDAGTLVGVEVIEAGVDTSDQGAYAFDLLLRGGRLGAGPVVELGGGEKAFPAAQQIVEVGLQVGQVGDVGAEMVAAGATEPEWAGAASGLDIGRLGADPEGHCHLAEGAPGVLGVEQLLGLTPDVIAVAVEHERGDPFDGLAAAGLADVVVALGRIKLAMVHQFTQHVDGDPGIGVALSEAVAVGVEHDAAAVELGAVLGVEERQPVDPFSVGEGQGEGGDGGSAVGIAPVGGKQFQVADGGGPGNGPGPGPAGR